MTRFRLSVVQVMLGLLERSSRECMARKRWVVGIAVEMAASGASLSVHTC